MTPLDTASGLKKTEFAYDYKSRRVKKTVSQWLTDHWFLLTEYGFVYDGWNLIREQTTTPGITTTENYIWGLDLSGTLQGAGGIGGLLATTNSLTARTYLYTFDANGNVGQLVDAADGTIAAHYEYDPFGNLLLATGPEAENNPFRFSTKYFDVETGLYYYGHRYYSSKLGRWLNRDPLKESGGINLYVFVRNNAINSIDILGLYMYLGTKYFHGIENSEGKIGTVEVAGEVISHIARTLGRPTFKLETSVRKGGCQCCVVRIEFFLEHNVYLPLIGESFRENSLGPILEVTVDALHLEILTRHENAHVEAEKRIAKALLEKAESDFQGKCWTKWFCKALKRTWEETECQLYARKKIKKIVGIYWEEKTDEAEEKLNQYRTSFPQSDVNDYLRWVDDQCSSWKEKQFIKKEQGDACQ